jgi:PucR family transcriptional regulator, purine catabolism regulatory protein
MSFPADGAEQRTLIEKLEEAGASALAIGDQMYCPPLTDELLATSERLGLSVLSVEFPMPFVAISQAVAAANLVEQSDRLVRTEKIYRTVQRMVSTDVGASVLREPLAQVLGCEVHVCHRASGEPWYPGDPRFEPVLAETLREIAHGRADLRAGALVVSLPDGRDLRLTDIPTQQGALMVLVAKGRDAVDAILMQHAVTVLALELSQSVVAMEHRRRLGAELLTQLTEGRAEPRAARRQLRGAGVDVARARLYAVRGDDAERLRDVHVALWRNSVGHVVTYRSGVLYLLTSPASEVHDVLRADLGPDALIGVSGPLDSVERTPEAMREAAWALRAAEGSAGGTFHYGEATPFIGIGGIDDAAALVARVLGPLLEYERVHDTPLLATLDCFLRCRRSWQRTADTMQLHRQTVLYRIRKAEEITGRSTSETADIAELWLALRAQSLIAPARGGGPAGSHL